MGEDHKALSAFYMVFYRFFFGILGDQRSGTRNNIVKKIVSAGSGTEGMSGIALFPAILVKPQVDKVLVGENRK